MSFTLYTFWRSSSSYRVRIAMNVKGLPYTATTRHLRRKEHKAPDYLLLNPQGLLPALQHDDAVLTQSLAIIEYLNELYPEPPLLPEDPVERAQVRALAFYIASEMHPLCNLRVLAYLRSEFAQDESGVQRWCQNWLSEGFAALEESVSRRQAGQGYCHGTRVSMADICLVPQVYNARRFGCDLRPYPTICAITEHLESLPAFADARPEVQPDAE